MKNMRSRKFVIFLFAVMLAFPCYVKSQDAAQVFRPEELDQMLAPIALYPDPLLAQVLTAATYPIDIVAADRFIKEHPGLNGQALVDAAKDKDWSPSVKAMLQLPDVLAMMDNQLEWTTKIGDAFLAQQRDCMDSVQRLRQKALAAGNLTTTAQQVVTVDPQTQYIIIEPASPEIVYVPVYDPEVEYGTWWYPDYPPFYCEYPGYVSGLFLAGCLVSVEYGWRSWDCDWHRHHIRVNVQNFNGFASRSFANPARVQINSAAGSQTVAWQHNAEYRRGQPAASSVTHRNFAEFRGFDETNIRHLSPAKTRVSSENMRSETRRQAPGTNVVSESRSNAGSARGAFNMPALPAVSMTETNGRTRSRAEGLSAFSGAGRGASERAASFRGRSSFQSFHSFNAPSPVHASEAGGHTQAAISRGDRHRGGHR